MTIAAPRPDSRDHDVTAGGTTLTEQIRRDLEAGRSQPLRPADRFVQLPAARRPTLGGRAFRRTYLTARALGAIHPRLARRALLRLWFTPWVHPSTLRPVTDLSDDLRPWEGRGRGLALAGYTGGEGPTVVLVHGWAGRAADWRHLAHDLITQGWRVVVPDLPGHGRSPGDQTDVFELARGVAVALDQESPVAVVTHSMGFPATALALESGAAAPARLVALAPGRRMSRALEGFIARARLRPAFVDQLRRGIESRFGADVWEVLDVDRSVPDFTFPGLVVHDLDDDEVPVEDARAIAAGWPGAELVTTAGLGHRRILRDDEVRDLVVSALDR